MEVLSDPVRFDGISIEGEFFCTGDHRVSLRAEASATAVSSCSRCLEPVQVPVRAEIDALYAKEPDPDDPDLYSFEGNSLALEDAVRDALLLELPLQFFCKPDCKGLCPVCGVNLNKGTCTCQEGNVVTGPFSALKDYVLNNEEV
ncbi:MAG: DUF177 domain-containing protein [Clostridia bacterium]|nr:DUF177 domain-containing protein [Clostridia bacterium]